ncbi:hypothetical protein K3G63_11075 [Hymenobacter sp. HSC-4F20]|uniref:hypothetical protein n=1 Tax=Hymenobacter sp. HSC-4F20 TaxID=2864135 RepID=UPI001C736B6A|nr:hypothetical protein [Hymenobacter sp. HSC-4F20]MBX0290985.1 hypothetical protein [Hymenobacter sp. HSC-4F20]
MSITLTTTFCKVMNETTVTATDNGRFVCAETRAGRGARLTVQLSQEVRDAADRILRSEKPRPAYGLTQVPGLQVRQVVG